MSSPSKAVILSAPQGWGKTLKAEALRRKHGCASIVDEWHPHQALRPGALHLTHAHPSQIPSMAGSAIVSHGWD
jgi:hypothetical protein